MNIYKLKKIFSVKNIILVSLIIGVAVVYANTRPNTNTAMYQPPTNINAGSVSDFVKSAQAGVKAIPNPESFVKDSFNKTTKGMKEATDTLK